MKQNQKRVFAYTQAKTIDHHELLKVSGGSGSSATMTTQTTLEASAGNAVSWDSSLDVTVDW